MTLTDSRDVTTDPGDARDPSATTLPLPAAASIDDEMRLLVGELRAMIANLRMENRRLREQLGEPQAAPSRRASTEGLIYPLDVSRTGCILRLVIRSFRCRDTLAIYEGRAVPRWAALRDGIERKLQMLDTSVSINDLRSPPGNRLEALSGNRRGQHSIRVNQQFRICFRWTEQGPEDVEVVDYH